MTQDPKQRFRIRLRETTTATGTVEFDLAAASPADAIKLVREAYYAARAQGTSMLLLPDGQANLLERGEDRPTIVTYHLVDDQGEEGPPLIVPTSA